MTDLAYESRCVHGTEWPEGDPGCDLCEEDRKAERLCIHGNDRQVDGCMKCSEAEHNYESHQPNGDPDAARCFWCDTRMHRWADEFCDLNPHARHDCRQHQKEQR